MTQPLHPLAYFAMVFGGTSAVLLIIYWILYSISASRKEDELWARAHAANMEWARMMDRIAERDRKLRDQR